MVFPWVSFLKERKKRVSDIEFLAVKEKEGKIRSAEGFLSVTGDLATLTANTGKDMYLAKAKCCVFLRASANDISEARIELKLNGVIIETVQIAIQGSSGTSSGKGMGYGDYEFKNIGRKVLAGQIIKLEVAAIPTTSDVEGFIECFEETTGEDPRI